MNITTRTTKDRHGWDTTSQIEISPGRILQLATYKRSGNQLTTTATILHKTGSGMLQHRMALGTFGAEHSDYRADVISEPASRVTRATVEAQHQRALAQIETVTADASSFYAARAAATTSAA